MAEQRKPRQHYKREELIWGSCLTTNEVMLLLSLNSFISGDGGCFPGQQTLAQMCKFSDRTVRNISNKLCDRGVLKREHRYKEGRRTSDIYRVDFDFLEERLGKPLPLPETASARLPENDDRPTGSSCSDYRKMTTDLPETASADLLREQLSKNNKEREEALSFKSQVSRPQTKSLIPDGNQKSEALQPADKPKSESVPPPRDRLTGTNRPVTVGTVKYQQRPETIDMAEQWSISPGVAKEKLRFIAPQHKYPELVAHGLGELWTGPKYKDFDECAIAIAQKRKRDLQQRDDRGAGIGYIENLIKGEKWAALESLLDEAKERSRGTQSSQPETEKRGVNRLFVASRSGVKTSPEERAAMVNRMREASRRKSKPA